MSEADLMRAIQLELSHGDIRLMRNNVGMLQNNKDQWVSYGLGIGSSDLIGIAAGRGRFIAIEVKLPGNKATREQQAFLDMVKRLGGLAGVAHSVEEARRILDGKEC